MNNMNGTSKGKKYKNLLNKEAIMVLEHDV